MKNDTYQKNLFLELKICEIGVDLNCTDLTNNINIKSFKD